jgi:hypothetical protein
MSVRLGLMLTMMASLVAYAFQPTLAKGMLGGGIAGVLAFWAMAMRIDRFANAKGKKLHFRATAWTVAQMALYVCVLAWAYRLDRLHLTGVMGAAAGLFFIRIVVVILGLTGWDLKKDKGDADGTDR